jgi:hypothetical protein
MYAEASTILRAAAADFFFNCWYSEISLDNCIRNIPRDVHYHAKAFDWKRPRISMLEVEAVPQSCIPYVQIGLSIVLYMRSLLLVESFDLRPSNQYILVRVILSCFRFGKMCLCQVSLLSRCSRTYLTSSPWGTCTLCIWTGGGGGTFLFV